jgi:hypothetical protein
MIVALAAAFAIPMIFGVCAGAMVASHLCILTVTVAMFLGVMRLKRDGGQK